MEFKAILNQIERPYWSPVHPSKYIRTVRMDSGEIVREGWGLAYPEDIGYFNLVWLLSGVGGPPDGYARYTPQAMLVFNLKDDQIGRFPLKELAARVPVHEFYKRVQRARFAQHEPLLDALRLRV